MGTTRRNGQAELLASAGLVPAAVCARLGQFALSSIHRAVERGALTGQRVDTRLYVNWEAFRAYAGPLAAQLPLTAHAALEE